MEKYLNLLSWTYNLLWSNCRTFNIFDSFRNVYLWSKSSFHPLTGIKCMHLNWAWCVSRRIVKIDLMKAPVPSAFMTGIKCMHLNSAYDINAETIWTLILWYPSEAVPSPVTIPKERASILGDKPNGEVESGNKKWPFG